MHIQDVLDSEPAKSNFILLQPHLAQYPILSLTPAPVRSPAWKLQSISETLNGHGRYVLVLAQMRRAYLISSAFLGKARATHYHYSVVLTHLQRWQVDCRAFVHGRIGFDNAGIGLPDVQVR